MNHAQTIEPAPQSDDRYRMLVDAITDYAIYMLDPDGRVTNWNAGAQRFKGYIASEIIGSHFSRFYTDSDNAVGLPARALATAAREGKFEAEGWRVRKDGTQFWAHVIIDPIRGTDGSILGYAKITRDLSERRIAEDSLRRSEEQFRLLVQSVTDYAIYMLDLDGNVASWNAGAERIKGYRPDEIIGQHFSRFYSDKDRDAGVPDRALNAARTVGSFTSDGRRVRKDGSEFDASVVIDAVHNEQGDLIGFAKITRDVSERQAAQRELENAREALFQSQKMDAIGQLTGGVAHDFNNLLMAIMSSLELLNKRLPDDPLAHKLLNNAMQGAERGATLTQRMLAFARRQELTPTRVDVPKMVIGMADLIQRSLGPAWTIDTRFPLDLSKVVTDVNQLEMALLNLVVNARDAMPSGGSITIQSREAMVGHGQMPKLAAGKYICLSVIDSGTGMDAATLERAMEPFFTTKGVGKGTGLGLSMIHGLTEQLGGTFQLKSQLGAGTTAEIWLPVAPSEDQQVTVIDAPDLVMQYPPLTILAVDDDPIILMNTVTLLEDMGHTVFEADSGSDALAILRERPNIDLIITDYAMPGITGIDLAKQANAERPGMPVLLATGYGEMPSSPSLKIQRLGKPFNQGDLRKAVSEAMENSL